LLDVPSCPAPAPQCWPSAYRLPVQLAVRMVLLWTVEPVLILMLARWLLRDRITGRLAGAIAAASGGVLPPWSGPARR
jgi:hypothetical protein